RRPRSRRGRESPIGGRLSVLAAWSETFGNGSIALQSLLAYLAARVVLAGVGVLPRRAATALVDALAGLIYRLDARHRRIAHANLILALPELDRGERDRIARESFRLAGRNLVEMSRIRRLGPGTIGALVEYDPEAGLNNFLAARRMGRSILYLTGH